MVITSNDGRNGRSAPPRGRLLLRILLPVLLAAGVPARAHSSSSPGGDPLDEPMVKASSAGASPTDSLPKPWSPKRPKVFGYVQAHYRYAFATGTDSLVDFDDFRIQRVRIGVRGDVYPWLSYDIEFDPRAPEISTVLRDAYTTFRFIPHHRLRVGQQKMQFGYENRESSTRLFAVNRAELSDNLSRGVNLRDIGLGLMGNLPLGPTLRLEEAITIGNGAGMNVQADNTIRKNVWGRLGIRYKRDTLGTLLARIGISGASGDLIDEGDDPLDPADDFRLAFTRYGVDAEIDYRWGFLSAEYVSGTNENTMTGETDEPVGYYVSCAGKTRWRAGPIVRLDTLDDEFRRWTIGAYYGLPDERFRLMLNYERRTVKDGVRGDDKLYVWQQIRF